MWCKAKRIADEARAERFHWAPLDEAGETPAESARPPGRGAVRRPAAVVTHTEPVAEEPRVEAPPPPPIDHEQTQRRLAELEREAFAKGYASGEQAGLEAGTTRADAMLRRLTETLAELDGLRQQIAAQTERQMVQIALAVARRILRREVSIDQDLVVALARVALDRLGEQANATIRLNPEDYAAVTARRGGEWAGTRVSVVADPAVSRGGCRVESDLGYVDAGVDAQFDELVQALLGDQAPAASADDHGHLLADPVS